MNKNASSEKVIVDVELYPGVADGDIVDFDGPYRVIDSNYSDSLGRGILLEKVAMKKKAEFEQVVTDPMMEQTIVEQAVNQGFLSRDNGVQQYSRENPGDVYNMDVQSVEQQKFENEAIETAQTIEKERSVQGPYWERFEAGKNRIIDNILAKKAVKK